MTASLLCSFQYTAWQSDCIKSKYPSAKMLWHWPLLLMESRIRSLKGKQASSHSLESWGEPMQAKSEPMQLTQNAFLGARYDKHLPKKSKTELQRFKQVGIVFIVTNVSKLTANNIGIHDSFPPGHKATALTLEHTSPTEKQEWGKKDKANRCLFNSLYPHGPPQV